MERFAAGHQDVEPRTRREQLGDVRRRREHLLEVVEQQKQRLVGDVLGDAVLRAERLACGRQHELVVAERRERHPPDAVRVLLGEHRRGLRRESRLAGATRAGQRQQAHVLLRQQL